MNRLTSQYITDILDAVKKAKVFEQK